MSDEKCSKCGKSIALVGRVHKCTPVILQAPAGAGSAPVSRPTGEATRKRAEVADAAKTTDKLFARVLKLPISTWALVDDFWHREKLDSRTAAIRELIKRGLE